MALHEKSEVPYFSNTTPIENEPGSYTELDYSKSNIKQTDLLQQIKDKASEGSESINR